jgi:arabinosaccharide transport system substrate-binding protein
MVASLLCASLTGCGGNATDEGTKITTQNAPKGAAQMEMWVFAELHAAYYQTMVELWNEQNPTRPISLNITALPYDDMHNKMQLALQSGKGAPDLCDIEIGKFPNFLMGTPQLEVLNDVVEPYRATTVPSRLDVYSKDGNVYGLPTHVGASVIYYNTELMEKAGVDYTTIKTWDDYRAAGQKLAQIGVAIGTADTGATNTLAALLAQQGSDYTDDNGNPNINSKEAIRALTLLQDMLNEGILAICPGGHLDSEEGFGFINEEKVASVIEPLWYMSRFLDYMPDLEGKIAVAPIPVFEEGMPRSAGIGGTGTVVSKTAKDVRLAKDWLAFAKLSEEANIKIWEVLGFDPVNTELWTDTALTHNPDNKFVKYFQNNPFDVLNEIKDEIQMIKSTPASPAIYNTLGTVTLNNIFESGMDPKEALQEAQEQLENELN